ncbi:hypothetical protein N802_10605 [Knoellia sinensis KCTC 19936]|uniref:Uncharacterized protein n=1 Tax=Knoellia sinensis KCTC 19936 TaxID=1385520 RepID=A0A0A0J7Z1_9MICO|nr:hypothetical protein [Knoellia sinensis]KGN32167.1 hypothetical protein N802_10605 [Knoellia sinensis KCTC 19936]
MLTHRTSRVSSLASALGVALIAAVALTPATATAAPQRAEHQFVDAAFDGTEHLAAEDNFCGDWATTFHEVRTGGYRVHVPPGGQVEGEFHVNGVVDGFVELIPDDPSLPTYSGTYREKLNAIITGVDPETGDDILRVGQFRLRLPLKGTDGSALLLQLSGKWTVNAKGAPVVSREIFTCS